MIRISPSVGYFLDCMFALPGWVLKLLVDRIAPKRYRPWYGYRVDFRLWVICRTRLCRQFDAIWWMIIFSCWIAMAIRFFFM